ncbi:TPA: hypothetical protein ACH3X1_016321 [Trebouxia sp. C0004]
MLPHRWEQGVFMQNMTQEHSNSDNRWEINPSVMLCHVWPETRFDSWERTIIPEGPHVFRNLWVHSTLAVQEADSKGWIDQEHEAPQVLEASWESPTFDHQLMNKYLGDISTADIF